MVVAFSVKYNLQGHKMLIYNRSSWNRKSTLIKRSYVKLHANGNMVQVTAAIANSVAACP